jgi:cytochrome c-type biogenesis protein CcmH/NrfG
VEGIIYRYIQEQPDEPEFWLQQANSFIAQKKFSMAAANLEIVEALGGADPEAQVLLGDIYVNLEAPMLALVPYEKAITSGKVKVGKALDLAKMLSRRLDADSLEGFLAMIANAYEGEMNSPDSLTLLTLQAGNALSQNKKEEAMGILTQVVAKDPLNGSALLTLGQYYLGENEVEKAIDHYGRAEKVATVKVEALMGSARALVQNKQYRDAIIRLKEAQTIKDQPFIAQYINTLENFLN